MERRHVARLTVPARVSDRDPALQTVRLIESPQGARIEHPEPLQVGLLCFVELPPALGQGALSGRIVWTKHYRDEQNLEGPRQRAYRSGLTRARLTAEQQGALMAALGLLQTAQQARPLA